MNLINKMILTILPFLYMYFIWWQSSSFNPESIQALSTTVNIQILIVLGVVLELTHLFMFGILYLLIMIAFSVHGKIRHVHEISAFSISLVYALSDEIHQYFVPFRSFSIGDIVKDVIGILVMMYVVNKFKNRFKLAKESQEVNK